MQQQVIQFWFEDIDRDNWFKGSDAFDQLIADKFTDLHQQAARGELAHWRKTMEGRLAEIIVLDQFSRNLYRNDARAFAYDGMALVLAQEALNLPDFETLPVEQQSFVLLPFMHSESAAIHEQAEKLFNRPGLETNYEFELKHKEIIDRFGRYPHRNEVLGRQSTPEELEFLKTHKGF